MRERGLCAVQLPCSGLIVVMKFVGECVVMKEPSVVSPRHGHRLRIAQYTERIV